MYLFRLNLLHIYVFISILIYLGWSLYSRSAYGTHNFGELIQFKLHINIILVKLMCILNITSCIATRETHTYFFMRPHHRTLKNKRSQQQRIYTYVTLSSNSIDLIHIRHEFIPHSTLAIITLRLSRWFSHCSYKHLCTMKYKVW